MVKVLKKIIDIVLIILIMVLVGYTILKFTNKTIIYEVETGSMEDGIHAGDYILVLKKKEYKLGDVVTYKIDGGFITHRIVEKNGDVIITKGDANNIEDEEITVDNIVGKVVYIGGLLNVAINFKYAFVSFLLALYLLSYYFDKRTDKIEQNEDIKDEKLTEKVDNKVLVEKEEIKDEITSEKNEIDAIDNKELAFEMQRQDVEDKESTEKEDVKDKIVTEISKDDDIKVKNSNMKNEITGSMAVQEVKYDVTEDKKLVKKEDNTTESKNGNTKDKKIVSKKNNKNTGNNKMMPKVVNEVNKNEKPVKKENNIVEKKDSTIESKKGNTKDNKKVSKLNNKNTGNNKMMSKVVNEVTKNEKPVKKENNIVEKKASTNKPKEENIKDKKIVSKKNNKNTVNNKTAPKVAGEKANKTVEDGKKKLVKKH